MGGGDTDLGEGVENLGVPLDVKENDVNSSASTRKGVIMGLDHEDGVSCGQNVGVKADRGFKENAQPIVNKGSEYTVEIPSDSKM